MCNVIDDNIWDVASFAGVGHTSDVQGSGWGVGEQTIKLS